jgi:hypothetical protein
MSCARLVRVLALAALAASATLPAGALGFSSTLSSIKAKARPGQRLERSFQLRLAPTDGPARFRAHVQDWWSSEDGAQSFYDEPGKLTRSCGAWTAVGPVESEVPRGGLLDVRISVAVPEDLPPGGYWCVLTVDQLPEPDSTEEGVHVRFLASVSTGIFLEVEPVTRQARILTIELEADAVAVRVRNTGDVQLGVEGRVEFLRPGETEPLATALIPRATVLPDPIPVRRFTAPLPAADVLPAGTYLVRVILDVGLDHYIALQKTLDVRGAMASAR